MSTANAFTADSATMETASRHVSEVADAIDAELRNLDNRIRPITGQWSGAGSAAYQALHARWTEDTNKLRVVLGEISAGLLQNGRRYQANENEVVAAMTQAQSQL